MLKVWFLNVGHGDCTVIEHPSGRVTMVDINNSQNYDADSHKELMEEEYAKHINRDAATRAALVDERNELVDPIAFFKDQFKGRSLFRFILTHPDMDHMRGIANLFNEIEVVNFWDTANNKPAPDFRNQSDARDWNAYQRRRAQAKHFLRGSQAYALNREEDGSAGGDGISVLSPTSALIEDCNRAGKSIDLSLVLQVVYAGRRILLPGDAEAVAWKNMVSAYGNKLRSDVLKASHHGRDSGYHLEAIRAIEPAVTVTSVGRKPSTDAHQKYAYHCNSVFSTRYYGTVRLEIGPDGSWSWYVDRNAG